jgi:hypothetical protein
MMFLALIFINHIESGGLFLSIVHGAAALFRGGVRIALLRFLLDLIARVTACRRTGDGRESLAAATADLMTQEAADYGTQTGSYQSILILHRLRTRNGLIMTFLSRYFHRSGQRFGAHDLGRMGSFVHVVTGERTAGGYKNGSCNRARQKGYFHGQFLIIG